MNEKQLQIKLGLYQPGKPPPPFFKYIFEVFYFSTYIGSIIIFFT